MQPKTHMGLKGKKVVKLLLTILMLLVGLTMILPFLWMLSASFKPESDIFTFPIQWIPKDPILSNYTNVWSGILPFYQYYGNTIYVTVLSTIGGVITSLLSGYAFARINFKGKNIIFLLYLATLMFPNTMLLVPRLVIYRFLGIYNTFWALTLPNSISTFGTFLLKQYFSSLPSELFEAGKIDGCNEFRLFWRIAVPLVSAGIAAFTVFTFVFCWNDYENPLMFITDRPLYTIPLGVMEFKGLKTSSIGYIMAGSVLSLIPIFILFISAQKYFVKGIMLGAVKA